MKYQEDKGVKFGTWNDNISRLMYFDSTAEILKSIPIPRKVADYGGANGLLRSYIPNCITVDIDESKNPDIVDNILTHIGKYDLIVIRYVLHYLNDREVLQLFNNISRYHKGGVLIQQFVNNDLKAKYDISITAKETIKYFRTRQQLISLLPESGKIIYDKTYFVDAEYYVNRLGITNAKTHEETIMAYYYEI